MLDVKYIIFDLDDTLYPQIEFDLGCLKNASEYIASISGRNSTELYNVIFGIVSDRGIEYRKIFNDLFEIINFEGMPYIKEILKHYWSAYPKISLYPNTETVLKYLKEKYRLFIITDGYVKIQNYKIKALGISEYFEKIYITDSFGIEYRKPSKYVFDLLIKENGIDANRCLYVGNDPRRDFIPAKEMGMYTIRIKQGSFADITLDETHEANYSIKNITQIKTFI